MIGARNTKTTARSSLGFVAVACFVFLVVISPAPFASAPHAGTQPPVTPEQSTFVATYCVSCHSDRLKTAGLSLETLALDRAADDAAVWEKVARKLRAGEMPPPTVRRRPAAPLAEG